jgi:hypothetical protein
MREGGRWPLYFGCESCSVSYGTKFLIFVHGFHPHFVVLAILCCEFWFGFSFAVRSSWCRWWVASAGSVEVLVQCGESQSRCPIAASRSGRLLVVVPKGLGPSLPFMWISSFSGVESDFVLWLDRATARKSAPVSHSAPSWFHFHMRFLSCPSGICFSLQSWEVVSASCFSSATASDSLPTSWF